MSFTETGLTGVSASGGTDALDVTRLGARLADELGPRYAVDDFLGRGAFATVWKVHDRVAGETLAVKRFEGPAAGGRGFYRELSNLFKLRHERVVRIVNFLETSASRALFLEYCPGGTLRLALAAARREGRVCPEPRARALAAQLAAGLAEAHRNGLVHRDLKPENILFDAAPTGLFGGDAGVKLADFGLARALRPGMEDDGVLRALTGSPVYMAPEQFIGEFVPASDLYALGVILYELLHGSPPFDGSAGELARQHLRDAPVFDPALPEPWPTLLRRLLSKAPDRRPTADELLDAATWLPDRSAAASGATGEILNPPEAVTDMRFAHGPAGPRLVALGEQGLWQFTTGGGRRLPPAGLTAFATDEDGKLWAARDREVLRLRDDGVPARTLEADGFVRALAPGGGATPPVAVVVGDELTEYDWGRNGSGGGPRRRWTRPLRSSGLRPALARLAGGRLVAAEGPFRPRLVALGSRGEEQAALPLPGPCWDLGAWGPDCLYAALLVGNELRGYRADLDAGTVETLAEGVDLVALAAVPRERLLFGLRGDGWVLKWNADGAVERVFAPGPAWDAFRGLAAAPGRVAVLGRLEGRPAVCVRSLPA